MLVCQFTSPVCLMLQENCNQIFLCIYLSVAASLVPGNSEYTCVGCAFEPGLMFFRLYFKPPLLLPSAFVKRRNSKCCSRNASLKGRADGLVGGITYGCNHTHTELFNKFVLQTHLHCKLRFSRLKDYVWKMIWNLMFWYNLLWWFDVQPTA